MANAANPAPLRRLLPWSARHGSALLAAGIFGGVAIPPLARALHGFITVDVLCMVTLVLLRVDLPGTLLHLRRPLRPGLIVAFMLVACPILAWAVTRTVPLGRGLAPGVVIFATGCAATSSPAFARLLGLDPELSLVVTLATIILVPFTAPPVALLLLGIDLHIGMLGFMERLASVVGLPMLLSLALRRAIGTARLDRMGDVVDGVLVWVLVAYAFAVMKGIGAQALADPVWVAQALAAAFAVNYGLNLATAATFARTGRAPALTAGLVSGNRNMALYLAVLPAAADPRIALFFGLCQFPLYLSPMLLRPLYRRLAARPASAQSHR